MTGSIGLSTLIELGGNMTNITRTKLKFLSNAFLIHASLLRILWGIVIAVVPLLSQIGYAIGAAAVVPYLTVVAFVKFYIR